MKVLWLGRILPSASTSGDRVYSRGLVEALAGAGAEVTVLGLGDPDATPADEGGLDARVEWVRVPGRPTSTIRGLLSSWPLVVRRHATVPYRRLLKQVLDRGTFDAIVLDNYAMAWALDPVRRARGGPLLVHIAHNFESALAKAIATDSRASIPRRVALWLNAAKISQAEARLARGVSLVVTLTDEDAQAFVGLASAPALVLPPGHPGAEGEARRRIGPETPRRALLFGSFRWTAKEMNLRALLKAADARFADAGVGLDVVGEIAPALRRELEGQSRATRFHGFVSDPAPLFHAARIGLIPEATGGGFKLKTLDYVFAGLPVAVLDKASMGLPSSLRASMMTASSMEDLISTTLAAIDDLDRLNSLQSAARAAARVQFSWAARGVDLLAALHAAHSSAQASTTSAHEGGVYG